MKVKELLENPGYRTIPSYAMLKDNIAKAIVKSNTKFGDTYLTTENFNADTMYYGPDDNEYFVFYALTQDVEPLDISALYSGSDEISNELKTRLAKKPRPPSEYEMMVDCLQHEIIPMLKEHGATQICSANTSHYEVDQDKHPFQSIDQFSAAETFKKFADDINHVFFYMHVLFPKGIK